MEARLVSLNYAVPHCNLDLSHLPVVLGRAAEVDIRLDDHTVSPYHCRIEQVGDRLVVRDLGSTHGVFVNGCLIAEADLCAGDELAIGTATFLVERKQSAARRSPARKREAALC